MIAAFSQKASFVLDLMKRVDPETNNVTSLRQMRAVDNLFNENSFDPKATDGVFCKHACVRLKAAVSIDRG